MNDEDIKRMEEFFATHSYDEEPKALPPSMDADSAGIMFVTAEERVLFLKRGNGGDFPGHWCFPGGHQEPGETFEETAVRETREELGFVPQGKREPLGITDTPDDTEFHTFEQRVGDEFAPKLNGEHTAYVWRDLSDPPTPLHPGVAELLEQVTEDQ